MKTHHNILIIGGGTAGIMVAAQLLNKNKSLDIGLIEPSEEHFYQPAWTLVGAGTFDYKDTIRKEARYIPKGVNWIKEYAQSIDPDGGSVTLKSGKDISYDYLVVAPGIQINVDGIEGLKETLGKNGVCSNYTDPHYTWKVLQEFKGGNAIFTQANTPIKCGGAPQKIMYLAEDYFVRSGAKKNTNVFFVTPGSVIFGTKDFADTLDEVVARKNIKTKFFYELAKIDGPNKKAYFKPLSEKATGFEENEGKTGDDLIEVAFDMLHLAPPQSAPDFVRDSPLAIQEGPGKGWVDVDINTLQHNKYKNVFSLGDVANLPTAKTGAAVRKQAPVVVENILKLMASGELSGASYNGYSSCPLVTGYGKMVLAEFKYGNDRDSDPLLSKFMDTSKESWFLWILKKYILPYLYWNKMLRGKM